ncbi:ABC transporter ATP-binding protein [Thermoactinomyces mirandus]|uniref:ABC transporter ATP-binding protein n=1 Tax=Thermoactinomyces mirandus TaxID=2756294 RepID=A0A7W1XT78_9BACL|nr:ABC transporter ATP-binding protein [Thermoactinomyces mirandus]MBA4602833.1 ABC transporter ATP-binding protein [Thermoactinomyces mirandus]
MEPEKSKKQAPSLSRMNVRPLLKFVQEAELPKKIIVLVLFFSIVEAVAGLMVPWFTKGTVDMLTLGNLSASVLILLFAAFVLQAVTGGISTYFLGFLGEKVVVSLRKKLWNKALRLPISYFDENDTGDLVSRINNDTVILKTLVSQQMVQLFTGIINVIGALFLLFYLDWSMTLLMFVAFPLMFAIMRPMGKRMYRISKNLQKQIADFTSLLTQAISEIRLVKSYTAEPVEKKQGEQTIDHMFRYGLKEAKVYAYLQPLVSFVMMLMLVVVIGYGGYRVATGALTAGELVAFLLYLFQAVMPLVQMSQFFTSLQKALGATERLQQILLDVEEDDPGSETEIDCRQPIVVDGVSFHYVTGDMVLQDVSFTVEPGKVTAIVGPSGSGKTTLFSLLERFYQPTSGEIRLGETPISCFSLRKWRQQFGYVSQESPLINGTIRENICYGLERTVTDEEMINAAKSANACTFIQELPQGFETHVGERGTKLSGGQRQRIAIARALLRDPRILMLDEATSSLDSTSERVVQEALNLLMRDRTTLVIAHRLSTVVEADKIIVLEQGRITGQGTHQELFETHPLYRTLVKQQFRWDKSIHQ